MFSASHFLESINLFNLLSNQYGNVNEQIEFVAAQLAGIPELKGGFDAIGFSQGAANLYLPK